MSLIGSIFTYGIIIAGDSLATISHDIKLEGEHNFKCEECGKEQAGTREFNCPSLPVSTLPGVVQQPL